MQNRWIILAVLFLARTTMAFQYQSVAALSPFMVESYAMTLADIGILIGLYLGPGVLVAIPGGAIAARFGDRRVVLASLVMMLVGAVLSVWSATWELAVLGRVLGGIGGVIVNIVMTKMLIDWFQGREIGTAMGVFIASWPAGIALALIVLPTITAFNQSIVVGWGGVIFMVALSLLLFATIYRTPEGLEETPQTGVRGAIPYWPLFLAGAIWALYNSALAMVFAFGPLLAAESGLEPVTASLTVSLFIIAVGVAVPLGGILSDVTGRRDLIIGLSLLSGIASLPVILIIPPSTWPVAFLVAGLLFGVSAGLIMTLPSDVLPPETRAFGMGVFFAIYYAVMMVAPAVAGGIAERQGDTGVAFLLGAVMMAMSFAALIVLRRYIVARPA